MKKTIFLFLLLTNLTYAGDLKPFTSDGCSSFPDGTFDQNKLWLGCCIQHDIAYWKGGSSEEREIADQELQACVAKVGKPEIAKLMLAGVRVGGTPYLPTTFRWGYGWPYFRGYKSLSKDDLDEVKIKFKPINISTKKSNNGK